MPLPVPVFSSNLVRAFPGEGNIGQRGNVLGSAEFVGAGLPLVLPRPVTAVKLDAAFTRPGALVAIAPEGGGRSSEQFIGPGQVAYFGEASRRFRVRNALGSLYAATQPFYSSDVDPRGHVGFLCGPAELIDPDPVPVARPEASVLLSDVVTAGNVSDVIVAAGLRGIRVHVTPLSTNAPPTVHMGLADLVLGIVPRVFAPVGWDAGTNEVQHQVAHVLGTLPRDDTPSQSGNWLPHRNHEGRMDFVQGAGESPFVCFDRGVQAGALGFAFEVRTLTGTGLTGILLTVEGY